MSDHYGKNLEIETILPPGDTNFTKLKERALWDIHQRAEIAIAETTDEILMAYEQKYDTVEFSRLREDMARHVAKAYAAFLHSAAETIVKNCDDEK